MKIRILGSASGVPTPGRYNESVIVRVGENSYLLDAGEPCAATILNSGLPLYSIKAVIISHCHADHIGGLPMLLQVMWLCQSKGEAFRFAPDNSLKLFLPSDAIPVFESFLRVLRMGEAKLPYKLDILPVEESTFFDDGTARVSALHTTHLTKHKVVGLDGKPYSSQAYSFCFEAEGKKLVYSGDIGDPSDLDPFVDGADVLLVECAHFPPDALFRGLAGRDIKHIVVTHLHPTISDDDGLILGPAREHVRCKVTVARDNLELDV